MSQFTIQHLTNARALVQGTDAAGTHGQVVLDSSEWEAVKAQEGFTSAAEAFDQAVEEFFKPLTEAAAATTKAMAGPKPDPATFVVLNEGDEGTPATERVVLHLGPDAVVLRLIERGDTDRLIWVNDKLEVLAVLDDTSTPTVSDVLEGITVSDDEDHAG